MKDICSKRNLWCECKQCQEAWQEVYDEIDKELGLSQEEYEYDTEKELDMIFEMNGWGK